MTKLELPVTKRDIHYDAERDEVTLKREKFDALVAFARDLARSAQDLENDTAIARYRGRRAQAESAILETLLQAVPTFGPMVRAWIDQHSIKQLSERAGIPYATCHRIVNERLPEGRIDMVELANILRVISEPAEAPTEPAKESEGKMETRRG